MKKTYTDPVYDFSIFFQQDCKLLIEDQPYIIYEERRRITLKSANSILLEFYCSLLNPHICYERDSRIFQYLSQIEECTLNSTSKPINIMISPFSGVKNAIRAEILTTEGIKGIISIIYKGLEYRIDYLFNELYRNQVEAILNSFVFSDRLPNKFKIIDEINVIVTKLDSSNVQEKNLAKNLLIEAKDKSIPSLIASINNCNQQIMYYARMRDNITADKWVLRLSERIDILGEIKSIQGINPIIQAIGDACQPNALTYSSKAYYLLDAAKKALIKVGPQAISKIEDAIRSGNSYTSKHLRLTLNLLLKEYKVNNSKEKFSVNYNSYSSSISINELNSYKISKFNYENISEIEKISFNLDNNISLIFGESPLEVNIKDIIILSKFHKALNQWVSEERNNNDNISYLSRLYIFYDFCHQCLSYSENENPLFLYLLKIFQTKSIIFNSIREEESTNSFIETMKEITINYNLITSELINKPNTLKALNASFQNNLVILLSLIKSIVLDLNEMELLTNIDNDKEQKQTYSHNFIKIIYALIFLSVSIYLIYKFII